MKSMINQKVGFWLLALLSFSVLGVGLKWIDINEKTNIQNSQKIVLQEAKAHFFDMVTARTWNASHGGVYVLHDGLNPNPYLKDNVYELPNGQRMIKINPAWMTRQMAEIANQREGYNFNITSLNPINPYNVADSFEREALTFFEKNKEVPYYYYFKEKDGKRIFNFMGALKVDKSCMPCHAQQGYQIGDIRGGIRVSLPLENYNASIEALEEQTKINRVIAVSITVFVLFLLFMISRLLHKKEVALEEDNEHLHEEVAKQTAQLQALNETLEYRVREEINKGREKDKMMVAQSRQAAMGEMIQMLAHQWRQPLSTIAMHASNVIVDLELGEVDTTSLKKEQEAIIYLAQNLSKTIESFQHLFHPDEMKKKEKIIDVLEKCLSITQEQCTEYNILVEKDIDTSIGHIVDSPSLLQVYLSLMTNAIEAVEKNKGTRAIKVSLRIMGTHVVTTFTDNGPGIPADILEKIFDPYFSTKSEKNGMGLGLFMAKMIVEKHLHGTIQTHTSDQGFQIKIIL